MALARLKNCSFLLANFSKICIYLILLIKRNTPMCVKSCGVLWNLERKYCSQGYQKIMDHWSVLCHFDPQANHKPALQFILHLMWIMDHGSSISFVPFWPPSQSQICIAVYTSLNMLPLCFFVLNSHLPSFSSGQQMCHRWTAGPETAGGKRLPPCPHWVAHWQWQWTCCLWLWWGLSACNSRAGRSLQQEQAL